jgi:hypothetical protein
MKDIKPPAIVRSTQTELEQEIKSLWMEFRRHADGLGERLSKLRDSCNAGEWYPKLAKLGIPQSTAAWLIKKFKTPEEEDTSNVSGTGESASVNGESVPEPEISVRFTIGAPQEPKPEVPEEERGDAWEPPATTPAIPDPQVPSKPTFVPRYASNGTPDPPAKPPKTPAQPAAQPDPTALTDAEGEPIPEPIAPAFDAAKKLNAVCTTLDSTLKTLEEVARGPGGRLLRFDSIKQQLRDVRGTVWANRATHLCPYCKGIASLKTCEACKGEGWVNRHIWHQAPGNNEKAQRKDGAA